MLGVWIREVQPADPDMRVKGLWSSDSWGGFGVRSAPRLRQGDGRSHVNIGHVGSTRAGQRRMQLSNPSLGGSLENVPLQPEPWVHLGMLG